MSTNTYYIEHDGKKLTTFKQLKGWYLKFIEHEKKQDPSFNERRFAEMERKVVFTIIYNLNPTDLKASAFKKTLFEYLLYVIYNSLKAPMYPIRLPQDIYMEYLSCFNTVCDTIPEHQLQKEFIESEIERHERINSLWAKEVASNDPIFNHVYNAIQMFLHHLKAKITNYEHTSAASAHEKIVAQYYFSNCGLPLYENTIMFPEQLENRLIMECVAYKHALSDNWQSLDQDNDYFVKFINGTLLREFKESIFERINPLNNFEITKVFTLSLELFKTFKPDQREKEFIKKYSDAYWHPNFMEKVSGSEEQTAKYLISVLSKYYHLFVKATEQAFINYQSNLHGLGHIPPIPENKIPSIKLTPMQQEFVLQRKPFNSAGSFHDLIDEAIEKDLIEYIEVHEESEVIKEYKANFKNWICKKIKQSDISSDLFKMYFVYANFEQFILEINQPDYDNTPAYTIYDYRPFDRIFDEAIHFGLIEVTNPGHRAATYSLYDFLFISWLREKYIYSDDEDYRKHYTFDNFKLLIKEKIQQEELARANFEKEKLKHQMDIGKVKPPVTVNLPETNNSNDDASITFDNLLTIDKADFVLMMLENLTITKDGKPIVSQRKKSLLLGIVDALRDKNILPQLGVQVLCKIIATKIGLELNSKLNSSFQSDEMHKRANQYIKDYYKF